MPPAREYLRVSKDRSGRERSNTEQQDENRQAWPDLDFGEHYSDATSASRYARKARDDWPRLIADLENGTFGADVLVLWETSRGSRKVGDWVDLVDICEKRGVKIAVTEHDRLYNPANARDRKDLIDGANDAEYESAKTSGRVRRSSGANALKGMPHGRVLYGYRRTYDPETGSLRGQDPHPEQAPVVHRVFTDYADGRSARAIAAALNAEGTKTNRGNGWTPLMIHRMVSNPAYRARRVHKGNDFGPAVWPALVDDDLFERAGRHRDAARWHRKAYNISLLAGVVHCGCGERMSVHHSNDAAYYSCQAGYHAYRPVERLDRWVQVKLLARLARIDVAEALADTEDPAVTEARARVVELKAELDEAMACWRGEIPGSKLSAQRFAEMESHLLPQIAEAERLIRSVELPLGVDIPVPERIPEWWVDELTPEMRRAVVGAFIVAVFVQPLGRGRRRYDDADFTEIEWRR